MFSSLTLSLSHLIEPSLALRLLVVGAIGIALVRFLLQMRATRRRYDGIQTLPTSWIVGELLGHMENFVKNYSMMDVTIGEFEREASFTCLLTIQGQLSAR